MNNYDQLKNNLDKLSEQTYNATDTNFDISEYYLSDKEIKKKLLKKKSPNLTEQEVNLMVYGNIEGEDDGKLSKSERKKRREQKRNERNNKKETSESNEEELFDTELATFVDNSNEFNEIADDIYPIDNPELDEEVENLKNEVSESCKMLQIKSKEITEGTTNTSIQAVQTIPTMVGLVAFPSLNFPGAILIALTTLNTVNILLTQIREVSPYIRVLKKIDILLSDKDVEKVSSILNKIVIGLIAANTALLAINKLVSPVKKIFPSSPDFKFDTEDNSNTQKTKLEEIEEIYDKRIKPLENEIQQIEIEIEQIENDKDLKESNRKSKINKLEKEKEKSEKNLEKIKKEKSKAGQKAIK
jgi:hypothetical protein